MTTLKNDRLLKALCRETVDVTPVWIMRQAGRYLPEYRQTKQQAGDFLTLCKTPQLACEVTMQPLRRYDLDAAILFSDILTIPDAMGLGLHFVAGEGPQFHQPIRTEQDIARLTIPNPTQELGYVMEAVRTIRHELNGQVPLIGFAGSPWTLAPYMIEGGSSKEFRHIKAMLFDKPALLHQLLSVLADSVVQYLNAQIEAGAQAVQIFDSWGGVLSPDNYQHFSLHYMQRIISQLHHYYDGRKVPVILFTKGGGQWLEWMVDSGADALGLDWTTDLRLARDRVGDQVALQGNMDPSVLYASDDTVRQHVKAILEQYGEGSGHVFNLGHGIHQYVQPDKVKVLVDAVHEFSAVNL